MFRPAGENAWLDWVAGCLLWSLLSLWQESQLRLTPRSLSTSGIATTITTIITIIITATIARPLSPCAG
jgi:hypothetical protein